MRSMVMVGVLGLVVGAGAAAAQDGGQDGSASATLVDPAGQELGRAVLTETPGHGVLIRIEVEGLEPGDHGFHIHETGRCEVPDFASAGGHYAPRGNAHGVLRRDGKHAGDLLNLVVPGSGHVVVEQLARGVTLEPGAAGSLFDDDGAALVIHANPDDYRTQPSGGGGPKVACGVIR